MSSQQDDPYGTEPVDPSSSGSTHPVGDPRSADAQRSSPPGGSPYDSPPVSGTPHDGPPAGGSPYENPPPTGTGRPDFAKASSGNPYDTGGTLPPPPPPDPGFGGAYGTGAAADPRLAGMPPLAPLAKRVLARIIDAVIIAIPVSILASIFGWGVDTDGGDIGSTFGLSLLSAGLYFAYEGSMLTRSGQTIGKKLMKIRVAMLDNGAIPAGNPGWIRAAVYSLPALLSFLCVGTLFQLYNVLSCTWDKPFRQCLHDKAAKTVVVEANEGVGGTF